VKKSISAPRARREFVMGRRSSRQPAVARLLGCRGRASRRVSVPSSSLAEETGPSVVVQPDLEFHGRPIWPPANPGRSACRHQSSASYFLARHAPVTPEGHAPRAGTERA